MCIYTDNDYESREDYLQCLSEDYSVPLNVVETLASLLGEEEMFDGLICAIEDYGFRE